jgi:hypothetical protein
MIQTNIDIPLEEILSPSFKPSSLTKLQLRSLLAEHGNIKFEDLPVASAKKDVYLQMFETNIKGRRHIILKSVKGVRPEGKGIVVVGADGSLATTDGTALKVTMYYIFPVRSVALFIL